jgi:hypothetical protein
MAEVLEKESDTYIAKDPDPFEDRHPSRYVFLNNILSSINRRDLRNTF